jgi:hypothetical protein
MINIHGYVFVFRGFAFPFKMAALHFPQSRATKIQYVLKHNVDKENKLYVNFVQLVQKSGNSAVHFSRLVTPS